MSASRKFGLVMEPLYLSVRDASSSCSPTSKPMHVGKGANSIDISDMRFDDINWSEGTSHGKGRRHGLCLRQEVVGDPDPRPLATRDVRPLPVSRFSLRTVGPLASATVSSIVSLLTGAGIDNAPSPGCQPAHENIENRRHHQMQASCPSVKGEPMTALPAKVSASAMTFFCRT